MIAEPDGVIDCKHSAYGHVQDECRGWDINDLVFTPALWGTYQHLMRSDFQLFDSYKFQHEGGVVAVAGLTVLYEA